MPRHSPNALLTLENLENPCAGINPHTSFRSREKITVVFDRGQRTEDRHHKDTGRSPLPPSKTRMLPTIGRSQSPDAKNLFTVSKNQRTEVRRQKSDPTPGSQTRFPCPIRRSNWWSRSESNRRPPACKAGALPTELRPRSGIRRQGSGISKTKNFWYPIPVF